MIRKPKNIFLHFLNKDTQEICGVDTRKSQDALARLQKGLNASVLLCDAETFCFLPLGFWFESPYTRKLLIQCSEFVAEDYVRFSIRERDLRVFIEKKRQQYYPFHRTERAYEDFFDDTVFQLLESLNPTFQNRLSRIGEKCSTIWRIDHNLLLDNNSGDLKYIYSIIPDVETKEKIVKAILSAANNQEGPFVWKNIRDIMANLSIQDGQFADKLRIYFEKNYYDVYLEEYAATNLFYFSPVDQGIQFHSEPPSDSIANYTWFKTFLGQLGLDALLSAPAWKIVKIRQSGSWADLQEAYIRACNSKRRIEVACATALKESESDIDIEKAVETIRNILATSQGVLFVPNHIKVESSVPVKEADAVDVLVMVATLEEEEAITKNTSWECKETSKGYEYFVRKEGQLRFALARSVDMGRESTALATQFYINELKPRFLAMAGFCAGKRGAVQLGDVVVPAKVYQYGTGKQVSETEILPEINAFRLNNRWRQKVERFGSEWRKNILLPKPITYESQYFFLIKTLAKHDFCVKMETLKSNRDACDIRRIIGEEKDRGNLDLNGDTVTATEQGKEQYNYDVQIKYPDEYEDPELKLRVGVLATGDSVQAWDGIFQELEKKCDRKTCVLDMEGIAIAGVSEFNDLQFIIAKGVGDFASGTKPFDNRYIPYAVFSAYQFLVAFFNHITSSESMQTTQ